MAKTQDALAAEHDPKRKGLRVPRHFTEEGVHPYDELTWELRDAVITNWRDGTVAFEQRGVEFPTTWSLNATNIVAQKYFRGPLGTPKRERSVKQMIDRVAGTIADWGIKDGYFATRADGETFRAELTHVLVNQMAAFNSPVWFNVGVEENPQSSACQPYDALVSTPTGMVRIGELVERNAVGTVVYDAHGETRVRAVKANGHKQVFKVKLRNGSFIEATGDHLVYAVSERRTQGAWLRVDQLRPGMRLHLYPHRASEEDLVSRLAGAAVRAREVGGGTATLVEAEHATRIESEAALAGWLQADGFVGQYDHGTNRSLTVEFMTVTDEEHDWVQQHLSVVFPDVHQHVREFQTANPKLHGRRIRLYGQALRGFVDAWDLLPRRHDLRVPARLWNAPNEVVAAYLRSVFQAEGYVSVRGDGSGIHGTSKVALAVISERWTEDLQLLLLRLGIYSRRIRKQEQRADRSDLFELSIGQRSERFAFAARVGFLSEDKRIKLAAALSLDGKVCPDLREEEIVGIEDRGVQAVYDIQTDSGEYLSNNIRVHNCFILSVEDNLPSILNWYTEEGLIFKGGSGAGINLSTIRSSRELLSSGGQASGPVSFMRGADASAGTVKSGGKTRRAAKMVILNVDHPDVRDFIWCKAKEERKARVLREAGFDMDLDGPDSISIQYQNANNSVRVTDDFMRAYENDQPFDLKAVLDGRTVETVRARELMREIAQAAWECADPGVQYDTTINDWHTLPESGRITASNPCSEYLSVDNSACNLASLNLLKFLRDDSTFDVESFKHAVEVVFLAQEILVGNSSYPTKKIDKNTKAFRQLGLGYANLGALLMARGKGYDSDGGRAWAGAITALMTGHAYRTSARIAEVTGPFEGYPKNRKAMLRVIGKHRAAVDGIDADLVPPDLYEAARDAWDGALELGKQFGYRNAQATVLAPTGTISFLMDCDTTGIEPDLALIKYKKLVGGGSMAIVNQTVPRALRTLGYPEEHVQAVVDYVAEHNTVVGAPALREEHYEVFQCAMGDQPIHYMGHLKMMAAAQPFISGSISKCTVGETLISTTDGLIRIGSLYKGEKADSFRDEILGVASLEGLHKTDAFYYGGVRPVRRVVLRSGHQITGTPNHRLLVGTKHGLEWRQLAEILEGDYVAQQYGADLWATLPPRFDDFKSVASVGRRNVKPPSEMTHELAFLLGAYASEGCIVRRPRRVVITNTAEDVLNRVAAAWRSEFGVEPRTVHRDGRPIAVEVHSQTIVDFFDYLGCGSRASLKRIPDAVLRSPRSMVLSFLQGLALDAYVTTGAQGKWAICMDSPELLDDLQAMLTNLGIVHGRISRYNADYDKTYDEVYASGDQAQAMVRLVPFCEPEKAARAAQLLARTFEQSKTDIVPGITPRELYELIPRGKSGRNGYRVRTQFSYLLDPRTKQVSRRTLERVAAVPGVELPDWLHQVLRDNLRFSPVTYVGGAGHREVFDISVPTTHAFVGNGIVNHNTVNMPETVTVEDVEQVYLEGWKLGLKAVAIYRDNCKVAQPLSATKKDNEQEKDTVHTDSGAEIQIERGPVRKRLPRVRPSTTTSFRVGDLEGYLTTGSYPDDGLGEIFVKVSKQGSTLSGVMDAFAIAVSIGLQYGVPLETYVSKFTNMIFEPNGLTDDPDVRMAQSIVDYVFRRLAIDHLDTETRYALGVKTTAERTAELNGQPLPLPQPEPAAEAPAATAEPEASAAPQQAPPAAPAAPAAPPVAAAGPALSAGTMAADAPYCSTCGVRMRPAGSCFVCESCGTTSGCS